MGHKWEPRDGPNAGVVVDGQQGLESGRVELRGRLALSYRERYRILRLELADRWFPEKGSRPFCPKSRCGVNPL